MPLVTMTGHKPTILQDLYLPADETPDKNSPPQSTRYVAGVSPAACGAQHAINSIPIKQETKLLPPFTF